MKLYNLGKFEGVNFMYSYVTNNHVKLSGQVPRKFIYWIQDHYRNCNGFEFNNGYVVFSSTGAETIEKYKTVPLEWLKDQFKKYKEYYAPQQMSLF